jgi:hypothetical protein
MVKLKALKTLAGRAAGGIGTGVVGGVIANQLPQNQKPSKLTAVATGKKCAVAKADGEYPYLLPNIRYEMQLGIPATRMNPISPLQMLSASNIVAEGYRKVRSPNPLFQVKRTKQGVYQIAQGTEMMNQPLGMGRSGA